MARRQKRANGTGTIRHIKGKNNKKLRNPYYAYAPADREFNPEKDKNVKFRQKLIGTYRTYQEAEKALNDYLQKPYDPTVIHTFAELYAAWDEEHIKLKNIKENTEGTLRSCWHKHLKDQLGDHDIRTTTFAELQDVIFACPSQSEQKIMKQILNGIYTYAVKRSYVTQNLGEMLDREPEGHKERIPFTLEDIKGFWQLAEENKDDPDFAKRGPDMLLLMLYSGMRIEEACRMQLDNIHFDKGYMLGGNKTDAGKKRTIPIHPEIKEPLERLIAAAKANHLTALWRPTGARLFRGTYFYKMVDQKKHTPHDTRVTFTTYWRMQGLSEIALAKIVGHKNKTVTDLYTKPTRSFLISEMKKFAYKPIEE